LVFASHVSCISGQRLPAREICALAQSRGALAMIDGAHALGQFPVDVAELGCDAYIGCGHKWLLGPQGTSMAFIARRHLETFQPSWIGLGAEVEDSLDLDTRSYQLRDTMRRFEFGTKPWTLFPGLGRAIKFIQTLGLDHIEARVRPLATALKECLCALPHLRLLTPLEPAHSAGIVSLRLGEAAPPNLKEMLWERYRLLSAYWHVPRLLRLSVACFTRQGELDQAAEAIARYAA
jgi:selenocysteine lyase/cysteine desulfurase